MDDMEEMARLLKRRGMVDRESGLAAAEASRGALRQAGRIATPVLGDLYQETLVMMNFLTRATGFHNGAIQGIRDDNPYAAFVLLRSLAENAAAMIWLLAKPQDMARFVLVKDNWPIPVGRLNDFAVTRIGNYQAIYSQLSEFAHPNSANVASTLRMGEGDREVEWTSYPQFKSDGDHRMACLWAVELGEANASLWVECTSAFLPPATSR